MGRGSKKQRTNLSRSELKKRKLPEDKMSTEKAALDSVTPTTEHGFNEQINGENTANITKEIAIKENKESSSELSATNLATDNQTQMKSSVATLDISSCDQTPLPSAVCSEAPLKADIDSQVNDTREEGLAKSKPDDTKFYTISEVGDILKKCQNNYEQKLLEKEREKIAISEQYVALKLEKEELGKDTRRIAECYQNDAKRFDDECDKLHGDIKSLAHRLEELKKEKQNQAEKFKTEKENLQSRIMNLEKENQKLLGKITNLESEKTNLLDEYSTTKEENESLKMKLKEQDEHRMQVFEKLQQLYQTSKNIVVNGNGCKDEIYDRAANTLQPDHLNEFFDEIQEILIQEQKQQNEFAILVQTLNEEKQQLRMKNEDLEMQNKLWESKYHLLEKQKMTILIDKEEEEVRNIILENKVKFLKEKSSSNFEKIQKIQASLNILTSFNEKSQKSFFPFNRNVNCSRLSTLISTMEQTLLELSISQGSEKHQFDYSNKVDFHNDNGLVSEKKKNPKIRKESKNAGCFPKLKRKQNEKENGSAENQVEGCGGKEKQ